MKLVANIQLTPTKDEARLLRQTLEACNAACNAASQSGFDEFGPKKVRQFNLQKVAYHRLRDEFGLTAQAAVRSIAKVADAYAAVKANGHKLEGAIQFRKHAAQPYDDRIFRFLPGADQISIWTLTGRIKLPFICGDRQRSLLAYRKGEVDLMLVRGKWYLAVVCDVPAPEAIGIEDVLGVDFGVVNLAFDSGGRSYTGADVEKVRSRFALKRAVLQRRGTKGAKRRLKKLSGKEARFRKHTNHVISKELVASAERSRSAIALEDLTHIRKRTKVRKAQRNRLAGWSFNQLRQFVTYKAGLRGIPVVSIDPRDTSRACRCCGVIDKANRKTQHRFSCVHCGYEAAADFVGALNIRSKGVQALGAALVISAPQALRAVWPREMLPPKARAKAPASTASAVRREMDYSIR
jgi:putative transposase